MASYMLSGLDVGKHAYVKVTPNQPGEPWHGDEEELCGFEEATHIILKIPMVNQASKPPYHICMLPLEGRWLGDGVKWTLSGDPASPTLDPSIKRDSTDGTKRMHGHYIHGQWKPVADNNW